MKKKLTTTPILALPNWFKPFIIDTDANNTGIGAFLSKEQDDGRGCVIAYASRLLAKQECNYRVTRKKGTISSGDLPSTLQAISNWLNVHYPY